MPRLVITGARVFDGSGTDVRAADVAIEDGRIAEVGLGLGGDERVDAAGTTVLPGLFDCHVHVMITSIDIWRAPAFPCSRTCGRCRTRMRSCCGRCSAPSG